ncbi:MAG: biotin--[acetyl-CoA-carboxylase] ligase [Gammaproteobacteria bacterium]|nr:biotin--[acetyl-CoA-carboxylase] ligase [Gammaproteobacteria bacterium]
MLQNDDPGALNWQQISPGLTTGQLLQIRANAIFDSISSTNDWALEQCRVVDGLPAVCFAEQQSQGRGRQGRAWASPRSKNIYMSLAWPFDLPVAELGGLALAAAIPVAQCLRQRGIKAQLKWPNDIWVAGCKIAGILLETRVRSKQRVDVVIGVGLNVSMPDNLEIDQLWTDMSRQLGGGESINRNQVAACLLAGLMGVCEAYQLSGFGPYIEQWNDFDCCRGANLEITTDKHVVYGTGEGIDATGCLKVRVDGELMLFTSADIKVRLKV